MMQLANKRNLEEPQTKFIERIAKDASHNAVENAFSHGKSVTIQYEGHIVKKYPSGDIEVIRKVENSSVMPEKRQYHL